MIENLRNPRLLLQEVGKAVANHLKDHFQARNAEGNRRGWARSNFWNTIRDATAYTGATDTKATVTIASVEFLHKLRGGTIRPGSGRRYLAIPLTSDAKAAGSPREWDNPGELVAIRLPRGLYLFRKQGDRMRAYYKLVKSVTHRPDPKALPPTAELQATVDQAVRNYE
jgi:hypothetical protein